MITYEEALSRVLKAAPRLPSEPVEMEHCVGRVLAYDLVVREPIPAFDYSAMDGYALAFDDLPQQPPRTLPVVGLSRPGGEPLASVEKGTACRIFTGAPIPAHADTVIAQEDVTLDGDRITLSRDAKRFDHIRRRGEDLAAFEVAIPRGERLEPRHLGLCGALDMPHVLVSKRPRVVVLTTGDELRPPGSPNRPGSVVNSNGPMITSLVEKASAIAEHRHAPDDREAIRQKVRLALTSSDLLLTIGGVSVGAYDHVRDALVAEGVELDFWKVAIKPGKPFAFGRFGHVCVLSLPGNPAAAFVTAMLFVVPLLRAMQGDTEARPKWLQARAAHPISLPSARAEMARSVITHDGEGRLSVSLLTHQASGSTVGLAKSNALAWLPGRGGQLGVGDLVQVLPLS